MEGGIYLSEGDRPLLSKQRTPKQYRTILLVRFFLWLAVVAIIPTIVASGLIDGHGMGYVLMGLIIWVTPVALLVALNLAVWTIIAFRSIRWPLRLLGLSPAVISLCLALRLCVFLTR